jgi:hypothetical protein
LFPAVDFYISESTKGLQMDVVGDCSRLLANFYLTTFDKDFRELVMSRGGDYMRFADDMVVRGTSEQACKDFVYRASEALHRLGLNINVAKVRYLPKMQFNKYWGFVIMDRFEAGELVEALILLKGFITNDEFGRKPTALKRAITLVAKWNAPEAEWWRSWIVETSLKEFVPLQLSREQLLSFLGLHNDVGVAAQQLSKLFLDQPFSQPKAIFLRALEDLNLKDIRSDTLQQAREEVRGRIRELQDPVLNLCLAACV